MPVPAMAFPSAVAATPGGVGILDVSWTASGDGSVVDYLVEADAGAGVVATATVTAPATTAQLTGLANNQAYTVTVSARDAVPVVLASDSASGTTEVAPPSGATLALSAVTSNSMTATFSADAGGGTNVWTVVVSTGGSPVQTINTAVSPLSITGLSPSTLYSVEASASNGQGTTSQTETAMTLAAPVVAPSNVVVTIGTETDTTVPVTWTSDGDPATYDVSIAPDDGGGAGALTGSSASGTTFTGLNPGSSYTVTVTATNGGGSSGGVGVANTEVADPVITTFTVAADGADAIDVDWAATAGGGTNLYTTTITPAAGGGGVTSSAALSTRYTGLTPGQTYTVGLTAANAGGSDTASDTATTGASAPVVGTVTVTSTGETSVSVAWTATNGGGVNGYTTSISPAGGAGGVSGSAATSTSYTGLNPGTTYTVTVTADNGSGTDSNDGSATTDVADPVITSFTASANGSTAINLSWAATNGGGTNTYTTAISPAGDAGGVSGSTATSTSYTGLTPGQTYTVTLTATNAGGLDSDSDSATTSAVAASAPTGVTAALGGAFDNFVNVGWTAPSNDGGSTITGYIVSLSNGDSITVNDGSARSTTFETVDAGTSVTAQVRAVTAAGNGASSSASNSVRTSSVPDSVTVVAGEWAGATNINAINVSWNAPSSTGGLPITGYVVEVTPPLENPIPVVDPGETTLVIGGLEQGTTYTVTVQAQNDRGNSAGQTSGNVLVPSTPGTVTDLVVEQSPPFSSGVVLTWALPEEDGGSPITGYSIVVDDRDPLVVGPLVTTASFTDLPVGDHNVTIQAITAAGNGATVTSPNFEVKAFAPFDSEEDFVTQLYTDFLRRTPDAGGLAFWTDRVADDGSNVQDIVEAFMRSPEFSPRRSVARLYFAYFNRQPDKGGFDFWTRQISSGAAVLENASQSFAQSPEFADTYGSLNDAEFIVLVYNNVLARRPEQGGFEFWLDQLTDGLPRGTMMTLFSESPENIPLSQPAVDVTVTYDGLLQREADVEGFRFWTGRVSSENAGLTELIRQFYFSLEYADRVNR